MIDLQQLQYAIYQNKVDRGFNVTDVGKEIVLMAEELGELPGPTRTATSCQRARPISARR
ncbi:MAG TPA: hypothetical protein VKE41_25055 [Roseiflexaceae bacterium]|nr:hypothetical protein [Roseiflexaceae bacterium]